MKKFLSLILLLFSCSVLFALQQPAVAKLISTCSCPGCDLQKAKLVGFFLGEHVAKQGNQDDLDDCNLAKANLAYANLNYAKLIGAGRFYALNITLTQAKLTNATLKYAEFFRVNAKGADFKRANLTGSRLKNCDLTDVNFSYASLRNLTTFDNITGLGSIMTGANFSHANLSHAKLDAILDNANFSYANLSHAILAPSTFELQGDVVNGFSGLNFSHANLTQASLYESANTPTPFAKTNFSHADLRGVQFFKGFRNRNPQPASIDGAIFCKTIMPDGKLNNRDCHAKTH